MPGIGNKSTTETEPCLTNKKVCILRGNYDFRKHVPVTTLDNFLTEQWV